MCEQCGCRGVQPIAQLMDEHLELLDLGGEAQRALAAGDRGRAVSALARFAALLTDHVGREERGIFRAFRQAGDYVEAVDDLEAEHRSFDEDLSDLDLGAADLDAQVRRLVAKVSDHIDKEDLGIFPAAVVTLGARGWEIVEEARRTAAAGSGTSSGPGGS